MNKPVNFELAKLLKEKGYHQPTDNYYDKDGVLYYYRMDYIGKGDDQTILAPTIAEIVMWLYEKYGIWINVDMVFGEDQIGFWYCIRESKDDDIAIQSDEYEAITKAFEEGIKYTLKNKI